MWIVLLIAVALLIGFALVFDAVARRRGTYRSAAQWQAASRARKAHFRTVREQRRGGAGGGTGGPNRR